MSEYHGCELPEDLWYDLDYLWARPNDNGTFTIGLTDPAQTMAGRVVAATFRKPGTHPARGPPPGTLESGKWVGGIPAPFDGTIERVNPAVVNDPGLVNVAPCRIAKRHCNNRYRREAGNRTHRRCFCGK